ncbi:hypothetical protein GOODEAATRI_002468 [Goodea atripinnis]|uniref:Uncharacterized protein n=1 Tax=Goodea atripinnis TaxID=208336 RepID=A0ABV0MY35_9TELE
MHSSRKNSVKSVFPEIIQILGFLPIKGQLEKETQIADNDLKCFKMEMNAERGNHSNGPKEEQRLGDQKRSAVTRRRCLEIGKKPHISLYQKQHGLKREQFAKEHTDGQRNVAHFVD